MTLVKVLTQKEKTDRKVNPHCNVHNSLTELQLLNTQRWHQQGELKRLAVLIDVLLIKYPNIPNSVVLNFINLLENECKLIQEKYEVSKLKIKAKK